LVATHRDIGFLCAGLTVVYAVSGIAVNHREDWDYNYSSTITHRQVGSPAALLGREGAADLLAREAEAALVESIVKALGRSERPRKVFWRAPDRLSLFFDTKGRDFVDYVPSTGVAEVVSLAERPLLRPFNFLHLNESRRWWTFVADGYAALLLILAITGAVLIPGRRGLRWRGGTLLGLGVLLPLVAYVLLRRF
jgi:hypothetical protein